MEIVSNMQCVCLVKNVWLQLGLSNYSQLDEPTDTVHVTLVEIEMSMSKGILGYLAKGQYCEQP